MNYELFSTYLPLCVYTCTLCDALFSNVNKTNNLKLVMVGENILSSPKDFFI